MNIRGRLAALVEVLGVYLAGRLVTIQLTRLFHLTPVNPFASLTVTASNTTLVTITGQLFVLLALQYLGWLLLVLPINYWHRRRGAAAYGFTRAGRSWRTLIVAGLVTAALCLWPSVAVDLLNALHPIGETAAWRQALFDMSWRRWQFWLLTAVMSWAFVPVVEELFFRGYCQRRLAEDWGDAAAIVGVTCLFTFAHVQYLIFNPYNLAKIVSVLLLAVGSGVVFARTRSLLPSIISHAIGNLPMTSTWQGIFIAVSLAATVVVLPRALRSVRQTFAHAPIPACAGLGIIGAGYAWASGHLPHLVYVAVGMVLLAVALEALERNSAVTATKVYPDPVT